jgi:hypothetical protein
VLDADVVALLEGGCGLIVASVGADGAPHASRGWGLDVVAVEPCRVRLLLDADDERAIANLVEGRAVAITGADVPTLRAVQLKGTSAGVEPSRDGDTDRVARHVEVFHTDITATDGTPRAILDRMTPDVVVAVVVDVAEVYDQTPGPGAGEPVEHVEPAP